MSHGWDSGSHVGKAHRLHNITTTLLASDFDDYTEVTEENTVLGNTHGSI